MEFNKKISRFFESELETRELSQDNELEEKKYIVEGLAIKFNSETSLGGFTEIIDSNALNETDFRDVLLFVNHNMDKIPLARSRNNNENSTLQLNVTDEGLRIRAELDVENNSEARSLYHSIKRGDMDGMSFAFIVDEDEWTGLNTEEPKRYIKSIRSIKEVSVVNFPAYKLTSVEARKSDSQALESARLALESEKTLDSEKRAKEQVELEKAKLKAKIKFIY